MYGGYDFIIIVKIFMFRLVSSLNWCFIFIPFSFFFLNNFSLNYFCNSYLIYRLQSFYFTLRTTEILFTTSIFMFLNFKLKLDRFVYNKIENSTWSLYMCYLITKFIKIVKPLSILSTIFFLNWLKIKLPENCGIELKTKVSWR